MILEPPLSKNDDAQLVETIRRDPQAFEALYRRYVTSVYRYCFVQSGNHADAEDLTAQTFLAALEALSRYNGRGPFAACKLMPAKRSQPR